MSWTLKTTTPTLQNVIAEEDRLGLGSLTPSNPLHQV